MRTAGKLDIRLITFAAKYQTVDVTLDQALGPRQPMTRDVRSRLAVPKNQVHWHRTVIRLLWSSAEVSQRLRPSRVSFAGERNANTSCHSRYIPRLRICADAGGSRIGIRIGRSAGKFWLAGTALSASWPSPGACPGTAIAASASP